MTVEQQEVVSFDQVAWDESGPEGCRLKAVAAHDGTVWNFVDYAAGARRSAWCSRSHYGFVVTGTLTYEFEDGGEVAAKGGEGFLIPGNRPHRGCNNGETTAQALMIDLS